MSHKTSVPIVFLICSALLPALVVTEDLKGCISTFSELEKSLLSRESNLDVLKEAFFPVNRQTSIIVDVFYYIFRGNMSSLEVLDHDYKFRWTLSSVHVFIRPALLECLSLYIYRPYTIVARLIVDPICSGEEIGINKSNPVCNETKYMDTEAGTPVRLLNELTTHLKSYVLHRRIHEDTRGYTAYFYDHDKLEDYCVIGYDAVYASNRLLINLSAIFLLFFLAFGTPAAFAYSYDTLYQYVKKNPNAQYFLWAVVLGIVGILYPLILATDIWTIVVRGFREKSKDVFAYYIVALASLIILPVLDIICVLLLWRVSPEIFKRDFPIPYCCSSCCPIFIQFVSVLIFTVCLQHLSFHGSYILLGFATSPLQATSLLTFYSAAGFCVVSLIAVILKVTHIKTVKGWKIKTCVKQFVPLLMIVIFIGFVSCFIAFYVQTTIMVGEYRNSGGLTSFIGSLAPSVLLSLVGLIEKKFVDFDITKSKKKETTDGGETADQSSSSVEANENEVFENPLAVDPELGGNGGGESDCIEQDIANINELEDPTAAE